MTIYEYGSAEAPKFLFIATAALEPFWAFADPIKLLAQNYQVYAVAADGHDPEHPGDFISVEKTVEDMTAELKRRGVTNLYGAYGLSMGGAIVLRFLMTSGIPVEKAVLDGAILPYTYPKWICKLILAKDFLLMRSLTRSRTLLELVAPPEQYTPKGHDPKQEYDDLMDFYKTYSNTTIKNVFWSANNYKLPHPALPLDTEIVYWYGEKEKHARRGDMAYLKNYVSGVSFTQISGKEHGELLMVFPEEWYVHVSEFLASRHPKKLGD